MARSGSWIATRPDAGLDQAAGLLARLWGIRGRLEDLPSERDRNVLLRPDGGGAPVVLKISNLAEDPAFLECQTLAMARLAAAGVPVARPVPALDGRTIVDIGAPGPPWARVLTYLPGRPLATVEAPSDGLLADLGATMGRCATALLAFEHAAARRELQWDVQRTRAVIAAALPEIDDPDRRARLGRVLEALDARVVPVLPALRTSVIHNDANDHNILVDEAGERVVGLLDFGDLVHSVTANEAAVATAYAMFHRSDPTTVVGPLVAGFDRACRLTDAEMDVLPDLVMARLGASVAIAARQGRLDDDPYLRISETPAWTLLERLEAVGPDALRAAVHEAVGR
jgi:Ser/Thr protein kinase RdoA (MazF antagonist)